MTGDSVLPDGREVKRLRRSRGWTQQDVTRRIQERVGPFSKRTLQSIEAGKPVHLRSIRLVAEELGIDVIQLLQGYRGAPHNLPSRVTSFVGRDDELVEIKRLLHSHRLLTLTGTGGSGKSRLALEVAHDLLSDRSDGVWLVELAPLTSPALVPQVLASALGVRAERGSSPTNALVTHLERTQALIILDNCEHLVDACARLAATLLQACPGIQILATSRESMKVTGESTYSVPPLQLPDPTDGAPLDELMDVESVRLFVERATAARTDFALSRSNAPAVVKICRHLDGMPLALELAAARVRTISAEEIAERLSDRFRLLTDAHRDTSSRHRTLRAVIEWSYDTLSNDERTLFRRLSVFAGGWTLAASERVCEGGVVARDDVLDLLSTLVDKSLVEVDSSGASANGLNRYRLLETVRQYAMERLREDEGEAQEVSGRHVDYFLGFAEEAEPALDGPDQRTWLSRLRDEHDNLRAALRACLEPPHAGAELGLRLAGALGRFWEINGYESEGRAMCAEALSQTEATVASATHARVLRTAGKLAMMQGDTEEARVLLEKSLAMGRRVADESGVAASLNELGVFASNHGQFVEAREFHEESLAIRSEIRDRVGVANSLMNLGVVTRRQGDHAAARTYLERSLDVRRELGDKRGIAMVLANLGNVAYAQHQHAEAHALYCESLTMFRELGDKHGIANTLNNLGNVAGRQGDDDAARSYYERGFSISRRLGDRHGVARALQNLGNVASRAGDYPEARVRYEESLAIYRATGDRQGVAQLLGNLGVVARSQGLQNEARSRASECLAISQELGDRPGVATSMGDLELLAWREGDYAAARSLCSESLILWRELDDTGGIAERLVAMGCIETHQGRDRRAVRLIAAGRSAATRVDYELERPTRERLDACIAELRKRMGSETFEREWSAGERMSLDHAVQHALPSTRSTP